MSKEVSVQEECPFNKVSVGEECPFKDVSVQGKFQGKEDKEMSEKLLEPRRNCPLK